MCICVDVDTPRWVRVSGVGVVSSGTFPGRVVVEGQWENLWGGKGLHTQKEA